jgi:signal transduction histidine kinase
MKEVKDGYAIEFRIPLELLGSTRQFGLAVVDVDSPETREIVSITGTLPSGGREAYGLVLLKSPEVLRIIEGLGYSGASIQVIDAQQRVRAEVGSYDANPTQAINVAEDWTDAWFSMVDLLMDPLYNIIETNLRASPMADDEVIKDSLAGRPTYQRRYSDEDGEIIVAAHPIIAQNEIIGTVLLKQNTERILKLRRDALQRSVNFSVISLLIFVALILVFSLRLASRIRRLESEATNAIDIYGRLKTNQLTAETKSGDEIGDLARSISGMLARLHSHNQFLENMPRTLRHEINNPLNALSTSLQNLEVEESEVARQKYLDAAKRGVTRIGMIVQNLADAASLEDALAAEETEVIDLYDLVQNYIANCRTTRPDRDFNYQGINKGIATKVSDYRVEQLLDKLIDNAIDFSDSGSTITVGINADDQNLTLFVTNHGPTIDENMVGSVFDSMVSIRESNPDNRLHFGMGLYVVRIIAERHGGSVKATNLFDGKGVSIKVMLPIYPDSSPHQSLIAARSSFSRP